MGFYRPPFLYALEGTNRGFQFHKLSQLFIRMRDGTISVAAMRVSNEDCSHPNIHG